MGNDDGDDRGVEDEAEHRGPEVRMALLGLRVALHRWQGAQQDRQDRDRKADRDQDRSRIPSVHEWLRANRRSSR